MGYVCPKCGQHIHGNEALLLWHLKNIHSIIEGRVFTETVTCGQSGCQRTFSGRSFSFVTHLIKTHRYDRELEPYEAVENIPDYDSPDDDIDHEEIVENREMPIANEEEMWDHFNTQELESRAVMLVSGLLASSSVVHSTVMNVVEQSSSLIRDITSFLKNRTCRFTAAVGVPVENEDLQSLMEDFETVSEPFKNMLTEFRQKVFFQTCGNFLQSEEMPLGIGYFPQNNPHTGNVQQVMKTVTFQYVPIKPLLKMLVEKTDLLKIASQHLPSNDGLFRDFQDGLYAQHHEVLSSRNCISLVIYIDDFEVTNPLSPKAGTHKLGAVYFTFSNIPPKYRSTLKNMFLLMLFNSGDAKMYGYQPIFEQFVKDMNELVTDGLLVHTDTFQGNVKFSVAQVVGDNLGINSLFGFAEGFTANFPCRVCRRHREEIRQDSVEHPDALRTHANYEDDLRHQNLQETGVKSPCPLNGILNFHITENRAPDVMHDMLEGVCPLELKLVFAELIQKGYFTLKILNSRITSFDYGLPDKSNKPCIIREATLRSPDGSPSQNAGQMWCLMRHITVLLGDLVPEDDEHWDLILVLRECMDIIFSPVISEGDIAYLEQLIQAHHMLYLELFPRRHLKPKHHFMVHYPTAIRMLGPLIHLWVMRFEAFHNFSRRLSHIVCNFQNIAKTLSYRNQMLLCYNIISRQTLTTTKSLEVGPGESLILASLDFANIIVENLRIPLYDEVFLAKWCKVYWTEYRPHSIVVVGKYESGDPMFGKISHVLLINSHVLLVYEVWHTIGFRRHYHSYVACPLQPSEVAVLSVDCLIDFTPLHASKSYRGGREYFITLRHIVG